MRLWQAAPALRALATDGCVGVRAVILEGNDAYIVRELLDVPSIAGTLGAETLTLAALRDIVLGVVAALGGALALGVTHGNLVPENIFQREDNSFAVTDFGLSRALLPLSTPRGTDPEALKADLQAVAALLRRGLTTVSAAQSMTVNAESGPGPLVAWDALLDRLRASGAGALLSYAAVHAAVAALPVPALPSSTVEGEDASHRTEVGESIASAETPPMPAVRSAAPEISPVSTDGRASRQRRAHIRACRRREPCSRCGVQVLTCSACGSDELTLVRTVSSGRVRRAVRGARFDLQCDHCLHVMRVGEKVLQTYNPFVAFERLQRDAGSSESA